MQKLKRLLGVLFVGVLTAVSLAAQSGVDTAFTTTPLKAGSFSGGGQVIQPDGKILVWGGNPIVSGSPAGLIARLNPDGTRDTTFNFCGCSFNRISNLMLQPDGKIIAAGNLDNGGSPFMRQYLARLNADGSLDNTFTPYMSGGAPTAFLTVEGILPNGTILAYSSTDAGFPFGGSTNVMSFNASGTTGAGIFIGQGYSFRTYMGALHVLPDGKFYVSTFKGVSAGVPTLQRYNQDITLDATWAAPVFPSGFSGVYAIDSLPNGDIIAAGGFDTINGVSKKNAARLSSAGTLDGGFVPPPNTLAYYQVEALPSGKFLVLQALTSSPNYTYGIRRLNADGSLDNTFAQSPAITNVSSGFSLDGAGRIVFAGQSTFGGSYFRLNPDGDLDSTFNPTFFDYGSISAMMKQADNKVIVAGDFSAVDATTRNRVARLNENGTVDTSFDPGAGFNAPVMKLYTQPDGKILALGGFSHYNGTPVGRVARINGDGSLDGTFAATLNNAVESLAVQADGKIIVYGQALTVNGVNRAGIARLNTDGTLDAAFNPVLDNAFVGGVIVEPDGKLTIAGFFNTVNGVNRRSMARLNADGTLDASFDAGVDSATGYHLLAKAADGRYYCFNNNQGGIITRRNANGAADASYQPPMFDSNIPGYAKLNTMLPQADGTLIVTGFFYRVQVGQTVFNRHGVARLKRDGSFDQAFIPAAVTDNQGNGVTGAVQLPNNKILIGGDFTTVGNVTRPGLARLNIVPLIQKADFDFDGDGKADIGVVRPAANDWYLLQSGSGLSVQNFGSAGDQFMPADFDGDGKTDLGAFRAATGTFWYKSSINGAFHATSWGAAGDVALPSDFDADGKADFIIYRPATNGWYRLGSTGATSVMTFGAAGDIPLIADIDGDGKTDPTVFRPASGTWWYRSSVTGINTAIQWGQSGDVPVPGDYDGDGKTDVAVFRPATGAWYIYTSGGAYTATSWGVAGDRPVAADYDGDGKTDVAVWRPSTGVWFIMQSTAGFTGAQFGVSTDMAIPNAFLP